MRPQRREATTSDEQHTEEAQEARDPEDEETISNLDLPEGDAENVWGGGFPFLKV